MANDRYDPYQDPDSAIDRAFNWLDWLRAQRTSITSYELSSTGGVNVLSHTRVGARITAKTQVTSSGSLTCSITCADGQTDERTVDLYAQEA